MAGRAGPQAAVQIDPPDPLIGPAFDDRKIQLTGGIGIPGFSACHFELGTVTVIAGFGFGGFIGRLYARGRY